MGEATYCNWSTVGGLHGREPARVAYAPTPPLQGRRGMFVVEICRRARGRVQRAFVIRSAHPFDKCADRIVVRVASALVNDRFLLNAFFGNGEREMHSRARVLACLFSGRTRGRLRYFWRRRQDANLESIQTFARVAIA